MMKNKRLGRKTAAAVASTTIMLGLCAPVLAQMAPTITVKADDSAWSGSDGRPNDSVTPVALQTQINALISFMNNANNSFTPASLRAMQQAVKDAQIVHDNPDSSTKALSDAYDQLVDAHNNAVSTWNLNAKIKLANDIKSNVVQFAKYNPASTLEFNTAYKAAQAIQMADGPSADTITKAVNDLQKAIDDLTLSADKDKLNTALQQALTKDTATATDASKKALANAIQHARSIVADPNATQDSVDQATANLNNAMNGIVQQHIDKSLLERTIQQASTVDTSKYTAATVLIFKNALAKAQTVDGDQHALQDQVDLANKTLMSAIEGLEAKVDKNELLENINIASEIDTSKLTQQQGSDLTSALKKAKEVAGNETATQTDVDNANKALVTAIKATQPTSIDKSNLIRTIAEGEKYQFGDYTKTSFDQLVAALANARTVRDDPQSSQTQIDRATTRISTAILGLVKLNSSSNDSNGSTGSNGSNSSNGSNTNNNGSSSSNGSNSSNGSSGNSGNNNSNSSNGSHSSTGSNGSNGSNGSSGSAGSNGSSSNGSNGSNNNNTNNNGNTGGSKGTTIPKDSVNSVADNKKVLADNIAKAKALNTDGYTENSKNALTYALAKAQKVNADSTAVNSEVIAANNELVTAMDSMIKKGSDADKQDQHNQNKDQNKGNSNNSGNSGNIGGNTGGDFGNSGSGSNSGSHHNTSGNNDTDSLGTQEIDPSDTQKKVGHEPNLKSVKTGVDVHKQANTLWASLGALFAAILSYLGFVKHKHTTHSTNGTKITK